MAIYLNVRSSTTVMGRATLSRKGMTWATRTKEGTQRWKESNDGEWSSLPRFLPARDSKKVVAASWSSICHEIGVAWSGRMLRLPLVLACLVPVNVFRFFGTIQADIVVVVFAILALFGAIAMSFFTRIRVASIARELAFELSKAGLPNDRAVDLTSVERFVAWCNSAQLTTELVRNTLMSASGEQPI